MLSIQMKDYFVEYQVTLLLENIKLLKLYHGPIKLKRSKYNDVTELACKYVPQEYQWFYTELISEENNTTNNRL